MLVEDRMGILLKPMEFRGALMGICHGDLRVHGDLMGLNGDLMVIDGLMGI